MSKTIVQGFFFPLNEEAFFTTQYILSRTDVKSSVCKVLFHFGLGNEDIFWEIREYYIRQWGFFIILNAFSLSLQKAW